MPQVRIGPRTLAQDRAEAARAVGRPGERLADLRPDVVAQAIANLSRPSVPPGLLRLQSNYLVLFQCQCGQTFKSRVWNATRVSVLCCRVCRRTGKSRFEFEVAALLEAFTGLSVELHHRPVTGVETDVYLPAIDLAMDLDPHDSHAAKEAADRRGIIRKGAHYGRFVRVRESTLPEIEGCLTVPRKSAPRIWAEACATFALPGQRLKHVSPEAETEALTRASLLWQSVLTTPPNPSLADHGVASEFVRNITHPGRKPEWMAQRVGDRCLWHCGVCGHEWEATAGHRTTDTATGCPPCAVRSRPRQSRIAPHGQSVAVLAPELLSEFVHNVTVPGTPLGSTSAGSSDRCLWACSYCDRQWVTTIRNRVKLSHKGCHPCNTQQAWDSGLRDTSHHDAQWERMFALLEKYVSEHGTAIVPGEQQMDGKTLGKWVFTQRKRLAEMSAERRSKLDAVLGWSWDRDADRWTDGYASLLVFAAREGHGNVRYRHLEGGYRLGHWVAQQRQRRAQLEAEQTAWLEGVPGWSWDARADGWQDGYEALSLFAEREGHLVIPVVHREGGIGLGAWASCQRALRAQLGAERVALLEAVPGWSWDARANRWQTGFNHLVLFTQREGHANPTRKQVEDGYNLGYWVINQRRHRDHLSSERQACLESLPGWLWRGLGGNGAHNARFTGPSAAA